MNIICEFRTWDDHRHRTGPFPHVLITGRSMTVGPDRIELARLNAQGDWQMSRDVFADILIYSDERDERVKALFFRGLGKPPLYGNPTKMLFFNHDSLIWTDRNADKNAHLCSLADRDNWTLKDDIYKSVQITAEPEPLCPVCGNIFRKWTADDLYQCLRCHHYYEIDPFTPAETKLAAFLLAD